MELMRTISFHQRIVDSYKWNYEELAFNKLESS